MKLTHKFVELIPDLLEPEVVYVSIRYKTASASMRLRLRPGSRHPALPGRVDADL